MASALNNKKGVVAVKGKTKPRRPSVGWTGPVKGSGAPAWQIENHAKAKRDEARKDV